MSRLASTLIDWYSVHKRELPWRETKDPYCIWISEIILQQTRVVQGYDYYQRFMHRFPTLQSLADASEEEVLKLWQGLGYYSRARNLHAAAQSMAENGFPATYDEVRALRGVGDYTAAAICSMAYELPYAVVDGNVYRVLARYFGIDTPIDSTLGKKQFAALAREQLDEKRPGLNNQAIMDFGAMQCVPMSPCCAECPLSDSCAAYAEGCVTELPVKQRRTQVTDLYFHYLYARSGEYTFLNKRTGRGIWQNLYELPLVEGLAPLSPEEFLASEEFLRLFDGSAELSESTLRVVCTGLKHQLSHRTLHVNLYEVTLPAGSRSFSTYLRVRADEVEQYPVPRLVALLLEQL